MNAYRLYGNYINVRTRMGNFLIVWVDEINLQILNCVWDNIKGVTCFFLRIVSFDYVCVNDSALKCVESAYILERWEVVEE